METGPNTSRRKEIDGRIVSRLSVRPKRISNRDGRLPSNRSKVAQATGDDTRGPIAKRPLTDNDESLVDLYPEDAWQRGRSIRLKTQDGMLLFQNWEQNAGDRGGGKKWRLWPITMVIGRGLDAGGAREPIVIEAEEGAVIEFSAALDVMSGVAPTIQRGQLMGAVHIRRVNANQLASDDDPNNPSVYRVDTSTSNDETLDIRTANVGIDRRKIWTTEAIHMQVGRALMVGRDLTLHLASSTGGASSQSSIARSLDRMELIYLKELTLPLGNASSNGNSASAGLSGKSASEEDRGVVQVRCDGRIEYDFALDQLLLDRNVRLVHASKPKPAPKPLGASSISSVAGRSTPLDAFASDSALERFSCESLRLTLRDPLNSDRPRDTALDWIDRIEAVGNPVKLSMRTQGFDLNAGKVLFDPVEGYLIAEPVANNLFSNGQPKRTNLNGNPANPATRNTATRNTATRNIATRNTANAVQIRNGDLTATLAKIVYRFDPKKPQQLGSVEVEGTGQVQYTAPASVLKSFRWIDSLRVAPLDVATPDAMDVRFGVWCDGAIPSDAFRRRHLCDRPNRGCD